MAIPSKKIVTTIELDIDTALNFLESQFSNPEMRWGELRSLINKQKAAKQSAQSDDCPICHGEKGAFLDGHWTECIACYGNF